MIRDYSFNVDVAKLVGVEGAVIVHSIMFWITKNKHNSTMFKDGRYWTFISKSAMIKSFPFLSAHQINRRVTSLVQSGYVIASSKYSGDGKTYWYSLSKDIVDIYCPDEDNLVLESEKEKPKTKNNRNEEIIEVLEYFNKKANRSYSTSKINVISKELILARLAEGNSVETLKRIIDLKTQEWLNDRKMNRYLKPTTLFNRTKFYTYIEELPTQTKSETDNVQKIVKKLTTEFGMRGIKNEESDKLAKQLLKLGYKNKDFLNMYLL